MPSVRYSSRSILTVAGLSLFLLSAGCGGKGTGDSAQVQIKDLETADGTINDGMTDLDGVQSESTSLVETGGNGSASAKPSAGAAQNQTAPASPNDDTEVVADQ